VRFRVPPSTFHVWSYQEILGLKKGALQVIHHGPYALLQLPILGTLSKHNPLRPRQVFIPRSLPTTQNHNYLAIDNKMLKLIYAFFVSFFPTVVFLLTVPVHAIPGGPNIFTDVFLGLACLRV
jgi:hypothetical protein